MIVRDSNGNTTSLRQVERERAARPIQVCNSGLNNSVSVFTGPNQWLVIIGGMAEGDAYQMARLAKAAPDLAEALKAFRDAAALRYCGEKVALHERYPELNRAYHKARAALAKAGL